MARYIEGKHAILEALLAGVPFERAFMRKDACDASELRAAFKRAGVPVEWADQAWLNKLSKRGAHQGVVCQIAPYQYASLDALLKACEGKRDACVLVLDHIVDEGNLGAIARSAEVLGASGLIIPKDRSAEVGAGAYKTSAGAVFSLPIVRVTNLASVVEELKSAGFWVSAASEHADDTLDACDVSGRACFVLGSEQKGVSAGLLKHVDMCVRIEQTGKIESLNVAQAATVFVYEWARQCRR